MNTMKYTFCSLFVFWISFLNCQSNNPKLSLKNIMNGKNFIGHWPTNHKWLPNGDLVFKWKQNENNISEYYVVIDEQPIKLSDEKIQYVPSGKMIIHENKKFYVYAKDGRIFKWKIGDESPEVLFESNDYIHSLHLVKDTNKVFFTRNNTLCYVSTKSPYFKELISFTNKEKNSPKSKQKIFLENQQHQLFEYHRSKEELNKSNKLQREKNTKWKKQPIALLNVDVETVFISPNENSLIYLVSEVQKQKFTQVENYVSKNGWSSSLKARPKVGRPDNKYQLFIRDLSLDSSFVINVENLSGIYDKPVFLKDYAKDNYSPKYDAPKNIIYHNPIFNKNGDKAIVEIRSADNKDRWITVLDLNTRTLEEIDHQHDDAWIGGPGIYGWNGVMGNLGWMDDDNSIWFQSEQTGYSHLYMYSLKKHKKKSLTKGNYEVRKARLSSSGNVFYITLNKTHPGNRNFYHLNWKTNELVPVLENVGNYDVEISIDEKKIAYLFSTSNQPWELYTSTNGQTKDFIKLTNSQTKEFSTYNWKKPEIVKIKGQDNIDLFARLYEPNDEVSNGAGVIFVHGAGYLQNAHNFWSGYYREYMFHNLLIEMGYTVLDIDYRASDGYGRDFRTAIYRHMGGWDLNDQLSGRSYLINELNLDSSRIGIYGGSYGGFITLMALLTNPGKFKCGAALRSVTDWAHYNHGYTSNILNTPSEDSIAYHRSSPINFANGLSDPLLMLHGVVDDNVQFQDVIRLSQRFIELEKDNWEVAVFPVEAHGFKEPSSWFDEYKRILKLFNENLK